MHAEFIQDEKRHNYHPRAHKYINENEKRLSKETQKYRPLAWIGR